MRGFIKLAAFAAFAAFSLPASAQQWPEKPIKITVGFSPGSSVDVLSRALAEPLSKQLGQPVIVENKSGGSGTLAIGLLASTPIDGYTIHLTGTGPLSISPKVQNVDLPPIQPVTELGYGAMGLVVSADLPVNSVAELVQYSHDHPGKTFFGSAGIGSTPHLAGELFALKSGADLTHVPYKGNADAMNDLIAGRVQLIFSGLLPVLPLVKDGRLKVLAIASDKRNDSIPDVPTMAEAGVQDATAQSYYGIIAPAGIPDDVLEKLNAEIRKAVATPKVTGLLNSLGAVPETTSVSEYEALLDRDSDKWGEVLRAAGLIQ